MGRVLKLTHYPGWNDKSELCRRGRLPRREGPLLRREKVGRSTGSRLCDADSSIRGGVGRHSVLLRRAYPLS
jgi:hypothetical protein